MTTPSPEDGAHRDTLRRAVDPAEIAEQRAKGWVDFHPETYCHRCGQRNVTSWATGHDLWAKARETGDMPGSDIVCPQCFTEMFEAATGLDVTWMLAVNGPSLEAATRRRALAADPVPGADEAQR